MELTLLSTSFRCEAVIDGFKITCDEVTLKDGQVDSIVAGVVHEPVEEDYKLFMRFSCYRNGSKMKISASGAPLEFDFCNLISKFISEVEGEFVNS